MVSRIPKPVPGLPGEPPRPKTTMWSNLSGSKKCHQPKWGTSKCSRGIRGGGLGPPSGWSVTIRQNIGHYEGVGCQASADGSPRGEGVFPKSPRSAAESTRLDEASGAHSQPLASLRANLGATDRAQPPRGLAAFDGLWASRDDGEIQGHILGTELIWADGSRTSLKRHGEHGLSMVVDNQAHTGVLHEGRIKWCDGDVWLRPDCPSENILPVAEPVSTHHARGLFRNWEPQTLVKTSVPRRQRASFEDMGLSISFRQEPSHQFY